LGKPILTEIENRMRLIYQSQIALIPCAYICTVLGGSSTSAWRIPTFLLLMPIHLSPEGLSVLGICAVKWLVFVAGAGSLPV